MRNLQKREQDMNDSKIAISRLEELSRRLTGEDASDLRVDLIVVKRLLTELQEELTKAEKKLARSIAAERRLSEILW